MNCETSGTSGTSGTGETSGAGGTSGASRMGRELWILNWAQAASLRQRGY